MLLHILFGLLAGLMLYGIYCIFPALSLWWLVPLFSGLYVALGLVFVLLLVASLLVFHRTPTPRTYRAYRPVAVHTLRWVLSLLGMRYTIEGAALLPADGPFLLVCNHRSAFDPLFTMAALGKEAPAFVSKPEVMRVPVLGAVMRRLCFLPIDRENPRNAVATIKQAAAFITDEKGISMGIYPEGTRSKDGALLPFHAGSFKIATMAKCPVAVASLSIEKGWLGLPRRTYIKIVDVMDTAYVCDNNTATLAQRAEEAIRRDLGQ